MAETTFHREALVHSPEFDAEIICLWDNPVRADMLVGRMIEAIAYHESSLEIKDLPERERSVKFELPCTNDKYLIIYKRSDKSIEFIKIKRLN